MVRFAHSVERYQQQTTIMEFVGHGGRELVKKKPIPLHFKEMTTEHGVDPNECSLSEIENFRKDIQALLEIEFSECALQMHTINCDSTVTVQWIFPEELMDKFFYAEYQELMQFHHIERLMIDGKSSHSVRQ